MRGRGRCGLSSTSGDAVYSTLICLAGGNGEESGGKGGLQGVEHALGCKRWLIVPAACNERVGDNLTQSLAHTLTSPK